MKAHIEIQNLINLSNNKIHALIVIHGTFTGKLPVNVLCLTIKGLKRNN